MIISNLMGGLGNQLFQIAASIGAANFYGNEWAVQGNWKYRNHFKNITEERYVDEYALPEYNEPHFHYSLIPNGNLALNGYFQSEKYFKQCADEVRKMFTIKQQKKIKGCAVHVRGGDYLKLKEYHYNLPSHYYINAIIEAGRGNNLGLTEKFAVFTDDEVHARTVLPSVYKWEFVRTGHEVTDLLAMSRFEKIIIANSSFSWWAAWLGQGKVYCPPVWFGEKKKHYITDDLYCEGWTKIQYE